jgi:tRNA pseudouridine38-40 synthase
VRTVEQAGWQETADGLVFEVTADAFLYHMVRRMVFAQVAVAQGRLEVSAIPQSLAPTTGGAAPLSPGLAPPQGLVLAEVAYYPDLRRARISLENDEIE